MFETVILNSDTGKLEPIKTKEEMLSRIAFLQNQYITLHRYGRSNFEHCYGEHWEHLKDEEDCQIFDSIADEIDDLTWDLAINEGEE